MFLGVFLGVEVFLGVFLGGLCLRGGGCVAPFEVWS